MGNIGKFMRDWNHFLAKVSLHNFDADKKKDFSSGFLKVEKNHEITK